jgi:hypothetical protein
LSNISYIFIRFSGFRYIFAIFTYTRKTGVALPRPPRMACLDVQIQIMIMALRPVSVESAIQPLEMCLFLLLVVKLALSLY